MLNLEMFYSMCLNKEGTDKERTRCFIATDSANLWIYESNKVTVHWDNTPGNALPCCVSSATDGDVFFWGTNLNDAWSKFQSVYSL